MLNSKPVGKTLNIKPFVLIHTVIVPSPYPLSDLLWEIGHLSTGF